MSQPPSPSLSDSALLDSLEEEFDLATERESRIAAIRDQVQKAKALRESEYGRVITYGEEKKLIERISNEKWCLIHFFHPEFPRCRIMDKRLEELAPKHVHTLFLRASVADTPFLISKFGIQVLPCVLVFVDGRCADRLIGFEELGDSDNFTSATLEFRLKASGVLPTGPISLASLLPSGLHPESNKNNGGDGGSGRWAGRDGEGEEDSDDEKERWRGKTGSRKGKIGIRNGLASLGTDDFDD